MDTPLPTEFDMFQYEAGEFAYDAYTHYMCNDSEHREHFRSLSLDEQKAWVYMSSEFKKRFVCAG